MNHQTHSFTYTNNPSISFCKHCSTISVKNKTTYKPHTFRSHTEINPITHLQTLIQRSHTLKPSKNSLYIKIRLTGINVVKALATKYALNESIYHSSIHLLDYLYLQKAYTENIQLTAIACTVLMTKFLAEGRVAMLIQNELIATGYIKTDVYVVHEVNILKCVDYDLSFVTAFDILNALLHVGITFNDEEQPTKSLEKMYFGCLLQLNSFVEKKVFVNYTPIEIAFAIVAFTRELYEFNNEMNLVLLCDMFNISAGSYCECYMLFKSKIRVQKCRSNNSSNNSNSSSSEITEHQQLQQQQNTISVI